MHIYCGFLVNIVIISEAFHSQSTDHRPNGTHTFTSWFLAVHIFSENRYVFQIMLLVCGVTLILSKCHFQKFSLLLEL